MSELSQRIYEESSLKTIFEYYNLYPNKSGGYLCPFHDDHNASMTIMPNDHHCTCWVCSNDSSGGKGKYSPFSFVKEYEEKINGRVLSNREVYQKLIDIQNLDIDLDENKVYKNLSPEQIMQQKRYTIMKDAMNIAERGLLFSKENNGIAYKYLVSRKISDETIKAFHIGYNNNSLLQDKLSEKYSNNELSDVGILSLDKNSNQFYDVQYNRLLIPICDNDGRVVGFGGRVLKDNSKTKYKNTKTTSIFHKSDILFNYKAAQGYVKKENEIIIVEGYFDVISAYEMGIKNVVALMGVELTNEHLETLKHLNVSITLCLDNDNAGREAMYNIIPVLLNEGIDVNVIDAKVINKGKDMNDFLVNGVTIQELNKSKISGMEYLFEYSFDFLNEKYGKIKIDNVKQVYDFIFESKNLFTSDNEVKYFLYVQDRFGFSRTDIENVCKPTERSTAMNATMKNLYCTWVKNKINKYAILKNNEVLKLFIEQGRLTAEHILNGTDNDKFFLNNRDLNCEFYCNEYLLKTPEYIDFENKYSNYYTYFTNLLNNVFVYDKSGKIIELDHLSIKQKDMIIKQFDDTFSDYEKKYFIESNYRFSKLYIADNINECGNFLLGDKRYSPDYDSCLKNFEQGKMCCVNYARIFNDDDIEKFSEVEKHQYLTENYYRSLKNETSIDECKFQCVLLFNNVDNKLHLSPENYVSIDDNNSEQKNSVNSNRLDGIPQGRRHTSSLNEKNYDYTQPIN